MNTAQDVVHYLLASTGGGAQDGEHSAVRQAVVHGVREVMQCRQWLWHTKNGSFTTYLATATATVVQGSNVIVVSDATHMVVGRMLDIPPQYFPTNIRIVAVSGNSVTVDHNAVASGSNVLVHPQVYYDLPLDMKDIDALVTNTVGTLHCYITPQEWQRLEVNTRGAGEPYYYTVMRSDKDPERYQVRFVGVPTNTTVVHYTYRYRPEPIKYMGYERVCRQGSIQCNGNTVSGNATAFPADSVGRVIRFGSTTNDAEPVGSLSPYTNESVIASRPSPTLLTIEGSLTLTPTTKYAITDSLDASPQMYTAILSAADMWYARIANKPGDAPAAAFGRDLRIAMENDVVSPMSGWPQAGRITRTARTQGWYSPVLPDLT